VAIDHLGLTLACSPLSRLRNNVPGLVIKVGSGFILVWVSTGLLTLAIVPYLIGACTYERYDVY
jgi:hypothetical protein